MIFAPRSCPSRPGLAMTTLIFRATLREFSLGPMELKGVVWLGTRTERFEEMVAFAEEVLGLERKRGEDGLAVFELADGDTFEVFDPQHPAGGHPDGIAGGFLVDDAEAATAELRTAGVEVTELGSAGEFRWAYFRAPDGNLYEVTSGPYARA
jgi:catechol 2,3-dioxygenase-like lactoylglutathione lyase family enzyme